MSKTTGCAAVAVLVALVGCSDGGEDEVAAVDATTSTQGPVTTVSPTTDESAEPEGDGNGKEPNLDEAIRGYIEGLASRRTSVAREALVYAAPDSVAYAYLLHQINVAEAALDGGQPLGEQTVETINGGYELCDAVDATVCNEFTEIEAVDGLVTDLRINETSPGPRLAVGDGSVIDSDGVTAEFLTAYRSISGEILFITIEVETGGQPAELNTYSATYRAPDGEQRQAANAWGPFEIGAKSTATIALLFPEAELGGTVTFDGYVGEDFSNTLEFTMETG